ncbi:hypothetical protein ABMA28_006675 [Loxostege sticticalis]|uniref:Uncharacterized protein n=1 Tax=Loxostege sticticalis TaxID=481309 RepID=A0ABD0TND5_LOXSC
MKARLESGAFSEALSWVTPERTGLPLLNSSDKPNSTQVKPWPKPNQCIISLRMKARLESGAFSEALSWVAPERTGIATSVHAGWAGGATAYDKKTLFQLCSLTSLAKT